MTFLNKLLAFTIVAVLLVAAWFWHESKANHHEVVQVALHGDSAQAAHDTSHAVSPAELETLRHAYGDSLTAVRRQVVQVEQEHSLTDRALQSERKTTAELRTIIKTVKVQVAGSAVATGADSARRASFHVYQQPYTIDATATLPASGPGRLAVQVASDTATFNVLLSCAAGTGPVRRADAVLTGPPWISSAIGRITQDPLVCNAGLASDLKPARHLPKPGLFFGYGIHTSAPSGLGTGWVAGIGAVWSPF